MSFERVIVVDWSAAARPGRGADTVWIGEAGRAPVVPPVNPPTRAAAIAHLAERIRAALAAGERLLIGVDFPLGYPSGLAAALSGRAEALALWDWLAARIEDGADNTNNRFAVAAEANARLPGTGPFWGHPPAQAYPGLPMRGLERAGHGLPEWRHCETLTRGVQSCWKLMGAGAVGGQALVGIAAMARLRDAFAGSVAAWPLEAWQAAPVVLAEVFPSLVAEPVEAAMVRGEFSCRDAAQVTLLARALAALGAGLDDLLRPEADAALLREEGWILGAGQGARLVAALDRDLTPPRLRNDCFAMPQGVDWVPVDTALERLRAALVPVTATEALPVAAAGGRVLAEPAIARRSNPPRANAAVDGYGFAHAALPEGPGPWRLPLVAGRAAAGQPYAGAVPAGLAIRILTGAILPEGVDTVVLDEDCATDGARVAFDGPVKARINTRRAGEDMAQGAVALTAGRVLTPADLALLSALGVGQVTVRRRLRVAVLSTGDEIVADPAMPAAPHQIFDANRPMLLDIVRRWFHAPVDLGHAPDEARAIAAALDRGAREADVILTSGGASAGDEDHVSRLLREGGSLSSWRIAIKPGRPLALALWQGVPVLGLPGNPVAALVCALVFGRPVLSMLAGAGWTEPQGYMVPAAFTKRKKAGRREYLRARIGAGGGVEVFASEGSGRISGLSWAEGLVALPDGAAEIVPGTPVRYLPYGSFGLG